MLDNASKAFFHLLARSGTLKKIASRYGMKSPTSFARRFIAGESVEEAIDAARQVETTGLLQTLDYLGESVRTLAEADAATRDYLRVIDAVLRAGIGRNLSDLKRAPPNTTPKVGVVTPPQKGPQTLARNTVRNIHAALRAMLRAAVDDGVLLSNPAEKLGRQLRLVASKATRQEEIKAMTRESASWPRAAPCR